MGYWCSDCLVSSDPTSGLSGARENTYLTPQGIFGKVPGWPLTSKTASKQILTSRFLLSMKLGAARARPLTQYETVDHLCWHHQCQNVVHMSRASMTNNKSRDFCRDSYAEYCRTRNEDDLCHCPHQAILGAKCIPITLHWAALGRGKGKKRKAGESDSDGD